MNGNDILREYEQWLVGTPPLSPPPRRGGVKFSRLNEACVCYEGDKVPEPLDELRIKVSRWLRMG